MRRKLDQRSFAGFPLEPRITMKVLPLGAVDERTGRKVEPYANWTTHPNNPMAVKAAE